MSRARYFRPIGAMVALLFVFSASFSLVPSIAHAQLNECIAADNECTANNLYFPCACPVALGLFTVAGFCSAEHTCTETSVIPTGITGTGLAVGASAAVGGLLLSSLLSSGSSQSSSAAAATPASSAPCTSYQPTSDIATAANDPCSVYTAQSVAPPSSVDPVTALLQSLQASQPSPVTLNLPLSPSIPTLAQAIAASSSNAASAESSPAITLPANSPAPTTQSPSAQSQISLATQSAPAATQSTPASVAPNASPAASVSPAPVATVMPSVFGTPNGALVPINSVATAAQNTAAPTLSPNASTPQSFASAATTQSQVSGSLNASGGLWGDIDLGSAGATVLASSVSDTQNTEGAAFYAMMNDAGMNATTSLLSLCSARPWNTTGFSPNIPPMFFDALCARGIY